MRPLDHARAALSEVEGRISDCGMESDERPWAACGFRVLRSTFCVMRSRMSPFPPLLCLSPFCRLLRCGGQRRSECRNEIFRESEPVSILLR